MRLSVVAALVLTVIPTSASAQAVRRDVGPIIDMHLHAVPLGEYPDHNRAKGYATPTSGEELLARTQRALERYHVVRAVTSGPIDLVRKWRAADGRRIIPGLLTDWIGDPVTADVGALVDAGELSVLGELTPQYLGAAPNDPRLEPMWVLAEEKDVPVGIHVGPSTPGAAYRGYPDFRMDLSDALLLDPVLLRHPKLRVYVMHAGWPRADEMIGLLYAHPQVYVDIGVIAWILPLAEFHRYLQRLVDAGFADRIMFGSDQMAWPELIGDVIDAVESARFLTAEQKRAIYYDNAARFLRLTPEQIAADHR